MRLLNLLLILSLIGLSGPISAQKAQSTQTASSVELVNLEAPSFGSVEEGETLEAEELFRTLRFSARLIISNCFKPSLSNVQNFTEKESPPPHWRSGLPWQAKRPPPSSSLS